MKNYRAMAATKQAARQGRLTALLAFAALFGAAYAEEDLTKKEPFYVNNMTLTIAAEPDEDKAIGVTPVSEGVWGREFPDGWQFYTARGLKFTDSRWELPGVTARPRMTRWGMILKKSGAGSNAPYTLIKPDGSETTCPANWIYPTEFVDSLAIVGVKKGYTITYQYITPDLKPAFPHLKPMPMRFEENNNTTPPLSEGLRAYSTEQGGYTLWGYIDAAGKIVIEPQFTQARSFHCGRALVKDKEGKKYFIDMSGKKAYEPKWENYEDVSDYDSNICSGPGPRFDQTAYYDLSGNEITTLKRGTPFHDGYAYCQVFHKDLNRDLVHKVGKDFAVLEAIAVKPMDFNAPIYDELGLPHFTSRMVDGGPCNGQYFFDYTIGHFSKEGIAPATMVTNDGKTTYAGFVDQAGHFVFIYSQKTK